MAQKEIKTSITISGTPEEIWIVLTDFSSYPLWNPFITKAEGSFKKGSRVSIQAGGMSFSPIILENKPYKELRWLGKLLIKGLFDGEHNFKILDLGNGKAMFLQEEKFSGILVGLFLKKLDLETKKGFEQMNEMLKKRVELFEEE